MQLIMSSRLFIATILLLAMVTHGGGRESEHLTTANYLHKDHLLSHPPAQGEHPDARRTTPELISRRGYPAEIHDVTTKDGYILEVHRIPHGRYLYNSQHPAPSKYNKEAIHATSHGQFQHKPSAYTSRDHFASHEQYSDVSNDVDDGRKWRKDARNETYGRSRSQDRKVVLIFPGVFASSADFVLNDPDQALGFILADQGYDVWLGNYRGNFYGRKHKYLSPSDPAFWDHTWNELARYDVPALLSYVRQVSGAEQVSYIGYSMGTSLFFAMFSYHPEITSWIKSMVALAPVAYNYHRALPLGLLSPFTFLLETILQSVGILEIVPLMPDTLAPQKAAFCGPDSPLRPVCIFSLQFQNGFNQEYIDKEYLPVILSHYPAGAGYRVFLHLLQLHASRKFQAYDYGAERNLKEYGQVTPPSFPLSNVKVPVALFWSDNDYLASTLDVAQTASELPNVALNHRIPLDFNHADFLWAENANKLIYFPAMAFLDSFY